MKDKYEDSKEATRRQMAREADANKMALIREIKNGLGKQLTAEIEKIKPPTKKKQFFKNIKKVLGL